MRSVLRESAFDPLKRTLRGLKLEWINAFLK